MTESRSLVAWKQDEGRDGWQKGRKKFFGEHDRNIYYLDCGDGFKGVYVTNY